MMWTERQEAARAPSVSDLEIERLVSDIERQGFASIENYFGADRLAEARAFVAAAVAKAGGTYVGFNGQKAMAGSGLDRLAQDAGFRSIFTRLYERATGRLPPPVDFYQVLRCLAGKAAASHSLNFHYDSYLITALIPIEIPTEGQAGDLLMIPNTRPVRSNYGANLLDKVMLDNKATQWALAQLYRRASPRIRHVKMVPGNLYFFWGYRSIHTNEACDPDKIRATALYHYVNPHAESAFRKRLNRGN